MDRVSVSEAGGHEFDSHRDQIYAKVAKLVDAQDSGSCSRIGCKGSSPFFRMNARESKGSSGFFRAFL